ncbi:MAG: alpha/beta hydrolase [Actinomycetota bacterium]
MTPVETFTVASTDGVEVMAYDLGGHGRPLFWIHATGFCAGAYTPLFARLLAEHDDTFHLYALDVRGHGRTALPAGVEPVWTGMADDVRAVIDAVTPGKPAWAAGHSMGGTSIVLGEAAAPGTYERAWTFEPILFPWAQPDVGDAAPDIAKGTRNRRAGFASRADALERYASRPPLSLLDPDALRGYVEFGFRDEPDGSVTLRCRPDVEASVYEHHNTGAFERLADVSMPMMITVGTPGELPADLAAQAAEAAANPLVSVVHEPDLSHFGPLQAPHRMADAIATWFGAPDGAAS